MAGRHGPPADAALRAPQPPLPGGERVWRLLACTLARRVWPTFDAPSRRGVETAGRFAGGLATAQDMSAADRDLLFNRRSRCRGFGVARWTLWGPWRGCDTLFKSVASVAELAGTLAGPAEGRHPCDLIRDLFGNPFRPASVHPGWRSWQGGTVLRVARAV